MEVGGARAHPRSLEGGPELSCVSALVRLRPRLHSDHFPFCELCGGQQTFQNIRPLGLLSAFLSPLLGPGSTT